MKENSNSSKSWKHVIILFCSLSTFSSPYPFSFIPNFHELDTIEIRFYDNVEELKIKRRLHLTVQQKEFLVV